MRIYADNGNCLCSIVQQLVSLFSSISTQYGAFLVLNIDLKTHNRFLIKMRDFNFVFNYITGSQSLKQDPIEKDIRYCLRPSFVRLRQ